MFIITQRSTVKFKQIKHYAVASIKSVVMAADALIYSPKEHTRTISAI